MENEKNYFTAGELASLYGIPKQTLLYYDKNELLIPAFVNKNGYRYYSVSQYLVLEIILNMRKLNISVHDIRLYLENRSDENFGKILQDKIKECNELIDDTQKVKNSLELSLATLEKIPKIRLNQIELSFQQSKILLLSPPITKTTQIKDRVKTLAHHNQAAFSKKHFKEFTTGWIIDKDDFFAKKFNRSIQYFTPVSHSFSKKHCYTRPEGFYISIFFEGTYYQKASSIYLRLEDFIKRNHLIVVGDIYVFPIKNHWLTEDTKSYINQISFQVEYQDE